MAWLLLVVGHLYGQTPAPRQRCGQSPQNIEVIGNPMKHRVGEYEIKAAYLALGVYDFIIHLEAKDEEAVAKFVLSLASTGSLRTTTIKIFSEAEYDKIVAGMV